MLCAIVSITALLLLLLLLCFNILAAFIQPDSHFADRSASGQNQKPAGGSGPPEEDAAGRMRLRWQEVSMGSASEISTLQLILLLVLSGSMSLRLFLQLLQRRRQTQDGAVEEQERSAPSVQVSLPLTRSRAQSAFSRKNQ